jgi:CheY-like chemotaxis protein
MPEKKGRIVVVDDDVQLVESVTTLLESVGYEVFSAHRAEKGFDLAKEKQPDLILLDVMFAGPPGPDGIEISRRIRKDPELKDTPVVMLSGVKKVLELGYDMTPDESFMPVEAFIDKPVKPEKLLTTIDEVLESKTQ